jgi:hypothetical protein
MVEQVSFHDAEFLQPAEPVTRKVFGRTLGPLQLSHRCAGASVLKLAAQRKAREAIYED